MPVKEKMVYPIMQKVVCQKCDTDMVANSFDSVSGQYHYRCDKCGCEEQHDVKYPRIVFVEKTPIKVTGLSWRSCEEMEKHGIKTVEDLVCSINHIDSFPAIVKLEAIQMLSERGLISNEQ